MEKQRLYALCEKKTGIGLIIFALVTLFNPSINIIDPLPDFIGYYLLLRHFARYCDIAPYFEEAATGLRRLLYISLAKLPGLMVVGLAQSQNTMDNDIVALVAFSFAALELIVAIPTVGYIFDALFYLGQRSDATALIRDRGNKPIEATKSFTRLFVILKCALYALPELLRLTRSVDTGSQVVLVTGSFIYPWAVLLSLALGFAVGGVWLKRIIGYVRDIHNEGKFYSALASLITDATADACEKSRKRRAIFSAFTLFTLAAFFSIDLVFDNFSEINLLPRAIPLILLVCSALLLFREGFGGKILKALTLTTGGVTLIASIVAYAMSIIFQTKYGYKSLLGSELSEAAAFYRSYMLASATELLLFLILFALMFCVLYRLVITFKVSRREPSRIDLEYRRTLIKKSLIMTGLFAISYIAKFISVLLYAKVQVIFTDTSDVTMPTVLAPAIPWFGMVTLALSAAAVLYALYYFSVLRDELRDEG